MNFFVYMLASKRNGTLYTGMTDDLVRRVWQHRTGTLGGFTARYNVKMLISYEVHGSRESAFARERQIKKWNRDWKLKLIEAGNREWRDLWEEISVQVLGPRIRGDERGSCHEPPICCAPPSPSQRARYS
ncbi:MAG: GIY-YIG nuclease family protein [Rhizobiales bacterium]|nr:GIY-YIG nuclease family protein [Hyphomicrobiales bacterium]